MSVVAKPRGGDIIWKRNVMLANEKPEEKWERPIPENVSTTRRM